MKTETIEITVSAKFAANLKKVARLLRTPRDNPGLTLECAVGWALEQLANRDDDALEDLLRSNAQAFAKEGAPA